MTQQQLDNMPSSEPMRPRRSRRQRDEVHGTTRRTRKV